MMLWIGTPIPVEEVAVLVHLVLIRAQLTGARCVRFRILTANFPSSPTVHGSLASTVVTSIGAAGTTSTAALQARSIKAKLAPMVSPNKTVEGAAAQVVASLVAAFVLRPWLAATWPALWVIAAALLLGVVGQVGDLAESVVKRSLGAKDTGGLIPGHGGVLDRLDGLLFNVPAFYYLVTLGGATR